MGDEKYVSPHPLPTPHEREILIILMEECAEVQQRASKMLRFGRDEVEPGQPLSNMERLSKEAGDLVVLVEMSLSAELLDQWVLVEMMAAKREKLAKYMQTEPDGGAAQPFPRLISVQRNSLFDLLNRYRTN